VANRTGLQADLATQPQITPRLRMGVFPLPPTKIHDMMLKSARQQCYVYCHLPTGFRLIQFSSSNYRRSLLNNTEVRNWYRPSSDNLQNEWRFTPSSTYFTFVYAVLGNRKIWFFFFYEQHYIYDDTCKLLSWERVFYWFILFTLKPIECRFVARGLWV
jgi:hypothetical protein